MADMELDDGHIRELQKEYLDFLDDDVSLVQAEEDLIYNFC